MESESSVFEPRFGPIEEREDLFETKLLQVQQSGEFQATILTASRDPGSANAISPVVRELVDQRIAAVNILTDGRARDVFAKNCEVKDITPLKTVLETDLHINPDVLLVDASSEQGIEGYLASTYPEVPMVVIEDYYGSSLSFLKACKERYGNIPKKICVIDEEARKMIISDFPELSNCIEVTGQPAFDSLADEETEVIQQQVKEKLNLKPDNNLAVFMSTVHVSVDQIGKILSHYTNSADTFLAFRKHPRDNTSYEEYYSLFDSLGINYVNAESFSSDEIGAAADLVITTWSTEGLKGIYRRKPTIHLSDPSVLDLPSDLEIPFPPVKLGASVGIEDVTRLSMDVNELLDEKSQLRKELFRNMELCYPADGKNAKRVADEIKSLLEISDLNKGRKPIN